MNVSMPLVAIEMQCAEAAGCYFIPQKYLSLFECHGAAVVAVSPETGASELESILAKCDGLVIPGGNDIDPTLYGQPCCEGLDELVPVRDEFEPQAICMALSMGMPFLGICRGMQILNVTLGGDLLQSIDSDIQHDRFEQMDGLVHSVRTTSDSKLSLMGAPKEFLVNSAHHQKLGSLGQGLSVEAIAEDGVIEAVFNRSCRFFGGVQWHPEEIPNEPGSSEIIESFVAACRLFSTERHL